MRTGDLPVGVEAESDVTGLFLPLPQFLKDACRLETLSGAQPLGQARASRAARVMGRRWGPASGETRHNTHRKGTRMPSNSPEEMKRAPEARGPDVWTHLALVPG